MYKENLYNCVPEPTEVEFLRRTSLDGQDDTTTLDQTAMIPDDVWMWVTQKKLFCFSFV